MISCRLQSEGDGESPHPADDRRRHSEPYSRRGTSTETFDVETHHGGRRRNKGLILPCHRQIFVGPPSTRS